MRIALLSIGLLLLTLPSALNAQESYDPHPDSIKQDGVPEGKVEGPFTWHSEIYPGTVREYWVYVPAQYDASNPTPLFVVQDGLGLANQWKLPIVLDNLIHQGDVPAQIGIFIGHGQVPPTNENAQPRFNRSFEYDSLGDRYARFLLKEILPEVSKTYNLSTDPNDRAIAGTSSGAICAFNVAWTRPNEFRRVLSTIGTYVDLRGGGAFPTLIRKFEPKPIRVFLQDGSNDLDLYAGSWWNANQTMLSALNFAGYDVTHAWGEGGHNNKHSASIIPDALRWLWRDYPDPIKAGVAPKRRTDILIPGEDWELVSDGHLGQSGLAVNGRGEVFFSAAESGSIHKIAIDGTVSSVVDTGTRIDGIAFGPDGKLYTCQNDQKQIIRYDEKGTSEVVVDDTSSAKIIVLNDGTVYFTDPLSHCVWQVQNGSEKVLAKAFPDASPYEIAASPDQSFLTVTDSLAFTTHSSLRNSDGSLAHWQEYGLLERVDGVEGTPANPVISAALDIAVDTEGRMYVVTSLGIQVLDPLGRVHLILNKPQSGVIQGITFGGPDHDRLYVSSRNQIYSRRIKAKGVHAWDTPVSPPKPGL
ncbi:MAG: gluconolactonase [Planctomycetaceae bacterium]|nr:gluconolactonase [Planctomycetaceae bacterium]